MRNFDSVDLSVKTTLLKFARSLNTKDFGERSLAAFAMLFFVLNEARAAKLLSFGGEQGPLSNQPDLQSVADVFGGSPAGNVAGVQYADIVRVFEGIKELHSRNTLEDSVSDLSVDLQSIDHVLGGELQLVDRYLSEAVQYAQLSTEAAVGQSTSAASTGAASTGAASAAAAGAGAASAFAVSMPAVFAGVAAAAAVSGGFGGSSSSSTSSTDTTAPTVSSMTSLASAKTVTLVFSESLDATNLPLTSKFTVTVGGVANPVASISVSGSTLVLTLTNTFTTGALVNVTYVDDAGNQTTTIQDAAGNDALGFVVGKAADGYISGAQIYLDANSDGIAQDSEILTGVTTDSEGNFFLKSGDNPSNYALILVGGTNIDTGLANTIQLKAPAGSTSINPLTTMLHAMLESNPDMDIDQANANIVATLGLKPGTDLSTYDPISVAKAGSAEDQSYALAAQKAAAQIAAVLSLASSGDVSVANALIGNLASQMESGVPLDLTSDAFLLNVFSGITLGDEVKQKIAANVLQISTVTSLTELTDAQLRAVAELSISSVAITSATGAQNSTLNAGDVVSITATMSEATTVTTSGGTPQLALNIGGTTVYANYASGSGTTALVFNYTILSGQTDLNGISIGTNSLSLNGGTLTDAAGNAATLTHSTVTDNASFLVDNSPQTIHVDTSNFISYVNSLAFASGDNILLDISTTGDLDGYLTDSSGTESTGSFLSGSLNDAISDITGLSLSELGDLGIDQISLAGDTLYIDSSDVSAMSDAGLTFDSNDNIVMLEIFDSDEALGAYLSTSLDDFDNIGADAALVAGESSNFIFISDSIFGSDELSEDLAYLLDSLSNDLVDVTASGTTTSLIVSADQFGEDNAEIDTLLTDENLAKLSSIGIDNVYYVDSEGDASLTGIGLDDLYTNITTTPT